MRHTQAMKSLTPYYDYGGTVNEDKVLKKDVGGRLIRTGKVRSPDGINQSCLLSHLRNCFIIEAAVIL